MPDRQANKEGMYKHMGRTFDQYSARYIEEIVVSTEFDRQQAHRKHGRYYARFV